MMEPPPPITTEFTVRIENVDTAEPMLKTGSFGTSLDTGTPGPIGPGEAFEFGLTAPIGGRLTLATMFVESNDLFFAPDGEGIALYDAAGTPVTGDVTAQIALWDAGTEANQEPGVGADQAPRQSGPGAGADDPDDTVRPADDEFGNLPAVGDVIRVTLAYDGDSHFTVRVENVSDATTLTSSAGSSAVPLSPGFWAIQQAHDPIFTVGQPASTPGLESLAEDGDPTVLRAYGELNSGLTVPLSPGAWAVHSSGNPIFSLGVGDAGEGLEALAEDGDPSALGTSLAGKSNVSSSGTFTMPEGTGSVRPAMPGEAFEFTVSAADGDRLSFATMFAQSNDLFLATPPGGTPLFTNGDPVDGDVTFEVSLYDAGTEVNEEPGVGPNQAPRQAAPDTGPDESGVVQPIGSVDDGFDYPLVPSVIEVTITPATP